MQKRLIALASALVANVVLADLRHALPSLPATAPHRHAVEEAAAAQEVVPPAEALACATAICGKPSEAKPYIPQYNQQQLDLALHPVPLPPLIEKQLEAFKQAQKQKADHLLALAKKVSKAPAFKMGTAVRALINATYLARFSTKVAFTARTADGVTTLGLDEPKTRDMLKDLTEAERDYVIRAYQYLMKQPPAAVPAKWVEEYSPAIFLKFAYPSRTLGEAYGMELEKFRAALKKMKELSPVVYQLSGFPLEEVRLAAAEAGIQKRDLDEDEIRHTYRKAAEVNQTLYLLAKEGNPLNDREAPDSQTQIKEMGGPEKFVERVKTALDSVFSDDRGLDRCRSLYQVNQAVLPDDNQLAAVKADLKKAKALVREKVIPLYSETTQKGLQALLDKVEFNYPPSRSEFAERFARQLDLELKEKQAETITLQTAAFEDLADALVMIGGAAPQYAELKEKATTVSFCDAFQYQPLSDHSNSFFGAIHISFTSATGPASGRLMTLMHEIGHALSKGFAPTQASEVSRKRFRASRQCLADQHTEELPKATAEALAEARNKDPEAEGPYTEEDFADSVAALAGKKDLDKNPWCCFLNANPDITEYRSLSLTAHDGDEHSGSLFRLLHYEFLLKQKMPKECEPLIASFPKPPKYQTCLEANAHL